MPTRIFGIGMHKTATTSLDEALRILGYQSAHWLSPEWARDIWREMNNTGRSKTLERHYALCDLPIPLLYKKLDITYPGSKFILTTRHEWKWLESVRNHWTPKNEFRQYWDETPFIQRIHTQVYGRSDFDEETFLNRYRAHNAEVLAYFRDRPQDLLVFDVDDGSGWHELCGFLRQPIPGVPYPQKFQTPKQEDKSDATTA